MQRRVNLGWRDARFSIAADVRVGVQADDLEAAPSRLIAEMRAKLDEAERLLKPNLQRVVEGGAA